MKTTTGKIAFLGLCTAVALVLAYVEALLPPLFNAVPGIKIGLPNIMIVFVLYRCGWGEASAVSLVRMIAVAAMFGNFMSIKQHKVLKLRFFLSFILLSRLWNLDFCPNYNL